MTSTPPEDVAELRLDAQIDLLVEIVDGLRASAGLGLTETAKWWFGWHADTLSDRLDILRADRAALAARTLPETEEWEYGWRVSWTRNVIPEKGANPDAIRDGERLRRRRPGPWSPVPSADLGEEDGR